uniref:Uncharacterized protein n=1 Tax=Anguilla anguilla TaxID=7936 RepID=A0A0E9VXN9_ANGAN
MCSILVNRYGRLKVKLFVNDSINQSISKQLYFKS